MAQKLLGLSRDFNKASSAALDAAKRELAAAAKAHGVKISSKQILGANVGGKIVVHAPLAGIERHKDADFAGGAPIILMIVKSKTKGALRDGSYLVKVQHKPGASNGTATFTDRNGAVVAQEQLVIGTNAQVAVLFPGVDSPGVAGIPVITSTHVWINGHLYVDCSGWLPHRILYFAVL
jgi:hypothetical protein